MKELQPLEADHSKLKEDFCTTTKSALGCENVVLLLRKFRSHFAQCNGISPEASRYLRPILLDILLQIFYV